MLYLCLGGCPAGGGGGSSGTAALLEKTLVPSNDVQRVEITDKVAVEIPAGLLKGSTLLRIDVPATSVDTDVTGNWRVVAGYKIELGDLHELDQDLVVEIPYDPTHVPEGRPPETFFMGAYWDPNQEALVTLPTTVDTERHVLVLRTRHLTDFFSAENWTEGFMNDEQFVVSYWPAAVRDATYPTTGNYYVDPDPGYVGTRDPNRPVYVEDIWWQLHKGLDTYVTAGLANRGLPLICTGVGGSGEPSRGKFLGSIAITLDCAPSWDSLRTVTAHELFHCVQNRDYYTVIGMTLNTWWMEATAEYAACRIAWPGSGMGGWLAPNYLSQALNSYSIMNDHAYNTAWFIDFLVNRKGVNFVDMFKKIAASWNPDLTVPLDTYLAAQGGLETCYRDFADYWVFDSASPVARVLQINGLGSIKTEEAAVNALTNPKFGYSSYQPSLTASLRRVVPTIDAPDTQAAVKLACRSDYLWASGSYAVLYRVPGDNVLYAQRIGDVHDTGQATTSTAEGTIYPGDILYIQNINADRANSLVHNELVLTISRITTPTYTAPVSYSQSKTFNGDCFGDQGFNGRKPGPIQATVLLTGTVTYKGHAPTIDTCTDVPFCLEFSGSDEITAADLTATVTYTVPSTTASDECLSGYPTMEVKFATILANNVHFIPYNVQQVDVPSGQAYHVSIADIPSGSLTLLKAYPSVEIRRGYRRCDTAAERDVVTDPHPCLSGGADLLQVKIRTNGS